MNGIQSFSKGAGIFPHPLRLLEHADPDGVIAVGGRLDPTLLIEAYSKGIFPWPQQVEGHGQVLAWFCPRERAILEFSKLHIPSSLKRQVARSRLEYTFNQQFEAVIDACASQPRRGQAGTWITAEMRSAYVELHRLGRAWSVEVLDPGAERDRLVGGIYGVRSEAYFSAESMFHRKTGASKLAFLELVRILKESGDTFVDIQMLTPHMEAMGARLIPRAEFLSLIGQIR